VVNRKRFAFSVLESLVCCVLISLVSVAAWDAYTSGVKQSARAGEALAAIQGAVVLMESIQEDLRQMAVLNEPGCPVLGYSTLFSTNGKSFMLRKSSPVNASGEMEGASFTVVVYQLREHPTIPWAFSIRRVERMPDGGTLPATGHQSDERNFQSLLLKDIRFDMVVQLGQMSGTDLSPYRTFVRVSLTTVDAARAGVDPRVYFLSNLFEIKSPEYTLTQPGQIGFARRCVQSKWNVVGYEVCAGQGYQDPLPPSSWTDYGSWFPFKDCLDKNGVPKDLAAPAGSSFDPFATTGMSLPPLRQNFVSTATDYMRKLVSADFRGRILGQVIPDSTSGSGPPAWVAPFSFDCSATSTQPVWVQFNQFLGSVFSKGPEAVEYLGHTFSAYVYPGGKNPDGSISYMVTTTDAANVIAGE